MKLLRPSFPLSKCTPPPKSGAYYSMAMDDYQRIDAASSSRLGNLLEKSPAHMRSWVEHGDEDTAAKRRGSLLHAAMLEPDRFAADYAVCPPDKATNLSRKADKEWWIAFQSDNPGKVHVRGSDGVKILGMRASLWKHPLTSALFRQGGTTELSLVWTDKETGVVCKCRIDRLIDGKQGFRIIDLKKTVDAKPSVFSTRIYKYGYHMQGAIYLEGSAAVLPQPVEKYDIIAVEEDPPYVVSVNRLVDDQLELGGEDFHRALRVYARCCEANEWPGYCYDWKNHRYAPIKVKSPPQWVLDRNGDD